MRSFIDIFNSRDLRYLIVDWNEEDNFDVTDLIPVFDNIMQEYESLTETTEYREYFEKIDYALYEQYQVKILQLMAECLTVGQKESFKVLNEEFGFKIKFDESKILDEYALKTIDTKIKTIFNRNKIRELKTKEQKEPEKLSWEEKRVFVHINLNILPEYNCSVSQYAAYINQVNKTIAARKKSLSNE